ELRRVVVGSEGVLGAITRVAVRVRPAPEITRYEGWMFPGFGAGAEALRRLEQGARRLTWRGSPTRSRRGSGSGCPACAVSAARPCRPICARGAWPAERWP